MVVRVWRGWTTPEDAACYLEHLRTDTLPALERLDGYEGVRVLRSDADGEVEFVVETRWRALADVSAFAGPEPGLPVIPPEAERLLARYERLVRHYELALGT